MYEKVSATEPQRRNTLKKKALNEYYADSFRIYRMMTTIWYNVVLDQSLIAKLQFAVVDQLDQLHACIISHQIDNGPQGSLEDIQIILQSFMQCIVDISINENSVHYLLHSNVVLDHVYEIFEALILNISWNFIKLICEKVYSKRMIRDLIDILNSYSSIMHNLGPLKFKKNFEKKKTVIVCKFCQYILKMRLKMFKNYLLKDKDGLMKHILSILKSNYSENKARIQSFFETKTIFVDYCLRLFDNDQELKNHGQAKSLIGLWKSLLDTPKLIKQSSGKKLKKSTIMDESNIYITVNETAFNLLNNIKASDEK